MVNGFYHRSVEFDRNIDTCSTCLVTIKFYRSGCLFYYSRYFEFFESSCFSILLKFNLFFDSAAAAYVNRVLPSELNLKLSQKCVVLVDQINAETNVKSNHVLTYSTIERDELQHNKRKAGGVVLATDVSKRPRLDSSMIEYDEFEDEENRYYYDENENAFDIDDMKLQAIKGLEATTLNDVHNINAWLELQAGFGKKFVSKIQ